MVFFLFELQVFIWLEKALPQATASGILMLLLFASLAIKLWHSILVGGRELFEFLAAMTAMTGLFLLAFTINPDIFTGDVGIENINEGNSLTVRVPSFNKP